MKTAALVMSALFVIGTATPAHAQLGGMLGKAKKIGDKAADAKQKFDDYNVTEKEEKQLGEQVSLKLRQHFGVYQDAEVTKYVTLVGMALAQASAKPNLDWRFIVLDTDGVNAYAAPGGYVHITRGLLGLMKNESELAGVLGHEITHISQQHTVKAIEQSKGISMGADVVSRGNFLADLSAKVFNKVFEGEFSQNDENNADQTGIRVANKVGYAPAGMVEVLKKIDARNGGREDRNGMFASHPATRNRIRDLEKQIAAEKLTGKATQAARYKATITFDAKPANEIATDVSGAAGLASGDKKKDDGKTDEKKRKEEENKKASGTSSISSGKQTLAQQQTSSAGARGGLPDRDAVGGSNPSPVNVKITAAEIDAFKKGIVA